MPHAPSPATTYRANRFRLLPNREDERTLRLLGDRVSALWNTANYVCRQAFLAKHPVPGYTALCATLRPHETYAALPSDVAQEVLKKLAEAWRGYGQLRTRWSAGTLPNKPGLPRYRKHRDGTRPTDFIPIKSARSYAIDAHRFALTLPADLRQKSGSRLDMSHRGLMRYPGAPGRGELRFDAGRGRWYLHAAVRVPHPVARPWQRAAAIDLGIRVLVSLCVEDTPAATHYLGREVLKDWDYWGRQISEHMGELAHRPKGQRASRKLRRLYHQRRSRWTHAWEALATRVAADCRRHKIGGVYLGWPKHIRRESAYGAKWNGRLHGFWSFDRASRILEKHLTRCGIQTHRVDERGTSSRCPSCASTNVRRSPRHQLTCRACGLQLHSDQAGSRNILRQQKPSVIWDGAEAAPRPETHRWNRHRWLDASNPSEHSEDLAA